MLPMLPLFSHALEKHLEAWEYFSGHMIKVWISMETMGHYLLVILNGMENHGEHGAAFSHDFKQHGKARGAWKPPFS